MLNDDVVAPTLLDSLLRHALVLNVQGEAYSLKDRQNIGIVFVLPAKIPADL